MLTENVKKITKGDEDCRFILHGEGRIVLKRDGGYTVSFEGAPRLHFLGADKEIIVSIEVSELRFKI